MAKLFIITGHGAGDPGACGNGYKEYERVRALAQRCKEFGGDDVIVSEPSRNYYKDNGISKLKISKDINIVEFHMDSGVKTAKGAHVIINGKYKADKYDEELSEFLSDILPGRSKTIVGRSDLANVNRAAKKGYNYRLIEIGFISNAGDVKIFNSKMDEIAKGILACFDIKVEDGDDKKDSAKKETTSKKDTSTKKGNKTVDELAKEVIDGKHGTGHANRKASLAKQGYDNYDEVRERVNELLSGKKTKKESAYYSKYTGKSVVINDVFKAIGVPSKYCGKWSTRVPVAKANGISDYSGTGPQNSKLIKLAKNGKLKKV